MNRRQAKKILRRNWALRELLGQYFDNFKKAMEHRERGLTKARAIQERDANRDTDRIYGRWWPESAKTKRRILRECRESAERMMPRIKEMLAQRLAARPTPAQDHPREDRKERP